MKDGRLKETKEKRREGNEGRDTSRKSKERHLRN